MVTGGDEGTILVMVIEPSPLPCLTFSIEKGQCKNRPASSFLVSLGKALNGCLHL